MYKLLTIIGARPQIIKAAALSRAIKNNFCDRFEENILHTGQHYDENMSAVFFDEMGIPQPDYNLNVGSGSHGVQTAKMIEGIEKVLLSDNFDSLVVYGDTNSTLAGAIAASKIHIPIFHIEAGLRSFNMSMPEEINRIMCDQVSSLLFSPTQTGIDNLMKEGFINDEKIYFKNGKGRKVFLSGDIMYDNSLYYSDIVGDKIDTLEKYGLTPLNYILATIHRDNNTDNPERLESIICALLYIAESKNIKVIIPLHPRTSKLLSKNLSENIYKKLINSEEIILAEPASFFQMIELEKNAKIIMTDSGGVQKESYFFKKPCIILRPETEWVEIVDEGAGVVVDADYDRIIKGYDEMVSKEIKYPQIFGDGHSAEFMLGKMGEYFER
jgi:UDP-GlcNAc3NAcA epimerase